MKVKVMGHKMPYGKEVFESGQEIDLPDNDPCTNVLLKIGRVKKVVVKKKKKVSKKYKTTAMKAED